MIPEAELIRALAEDLALEILASQTVIGSRAWRRQSEPGRLVVLIRKHAPGRSRPLPEVPVASLVHRPGPVVFPESPTRAPWLRPVFSVKVPSLTRAVSV